MFRPKRYRLDRARPLVPAVALLVILLAGPGCGPPNIGVNRDLGDADGSADYEDTMSPDSFVDRLGEPDEWKNEGEGSRLRMTAIWHCLDGQRREVTWRIAEGAATRRSWQVIGDRRSEGDCK